MIDDAGVRERALDPTRSFVVRAPAGSGKTTLLTQRVLRLLTTVDEPEQVVAITFTRKAAEEMRTRIVEALAAADEPAPADAFRRATWQLACAARDHERTRAWGLAEQPARLRILTIDALCQSLVRQMPVTAGMAGMPAVEEDAALLYRDAARDALGDIVDGGATRAHITRALRHLDNDWSKLEALLAEMLGRRDQWLHLLGADTEVGLLERDYTRIVETELEALAALLPADSHAELTALAAYAGQHLEDSPLAGLTALPAPVHADLAVWQALAALFLTKTAGTWRKVVNKSQGFPPKDAHTATMKQRWKDQVDALDSVAGLRVALTRIVALPLEAYGTDERSIVEALLAALRQALAHLMVACDQGGRTDFTAFALAALAALGEPDQPTDLALSVDYQLRHLLIDEFQDTSITQFELLRRLTAGWQRDDGRTLFLVGDPMQSIYRFRQADVRHFQHLLDHGRIGNVTLEPLALIVNFRAQAGLVDWINTLTPQALAVIEAPATYFVAQHADKPARPMPWSVYGLDAHDAAAEAAAVCRTIIDIRAREPLASIAILVRSRSHLGQISAALSAAGVPIAARDIKPLANVPVVADLFTLARALLHPADRVAWFALLRAPWCGLELADLTNLARAETTLAAALDDPAVLAELSADAQPRVARVATVMAMAQRAVGEIRFARLLEDTWIALGGPAVTQTTTSLADAQAFIELIDTLEREPALLSAERIQARLANRYASAATHDPTAVQLMTVHRAKGLEFDHVLIPGLGRAPRTEQKPLLLSHEELDRAGHRSLIVAPIALRGERPLYGYLHARANSEAAAEAVRLLYVALTRARTQVHLFGHARIDRDGELRPDKRSFLGLLWPTLGTAFSAGITQVADAAALRQPQSTMTLLRALPASLPAVERVAEPAASGEAPVEFDWAGITARHIGTVTHRLLQDHAERGGTAAPHAGLARFARGQLRALGVAPGDLAAAVDVVTRAFVTAIASPRGRWLFDPDHREAAAELCVAVDDAGELARVVIDRTFVDASGQRWIVDFKTGSHAGGGLEDWLDAERERYRGQLERYGRVMALLDTRPIMLGLYFPLVDAWREWPCPSR